MINSATSAREMRGRDDPMAAIPTGRGSACAANAVIATAPTMSQMTALPVHRSMAAPPMSVATMKLIEPQSRPCALTARMASVSVSGIMLDVVSIMSIVSRMIGQRCVLCESSTVQARPLHARMMTMRR